MNVLCLEAANTLSIQVTAGINMIGADVVEVMPELDPAGTTALAGANVAWELISLLAHKKKQNSGQ